MSHQQMDELMFTRLEYNGKHISTWYKRRSKDKRFYFSSFQLLETILSVLQPIVFALRVKEEAAASPLLSSPLLYAKQSRPHAATAQQLVKPQFHFNVAYFTPSH